jgi:hypothetical protein
VSVINTELPEYLWSERETVRSFRPETKDTDEFSRFILNNFKLLETNSQHTHPFELLQSADIILLGELHGKMDTEVKNSCIVNYLWQENFHLLTESSVDDISQTHFFDAPILENRSCWDWDEFTEQLDILSSIESSTSIDACSIAERLQPYEDNPEGLFDAPEYLELKKFIGLISKTTQTLRNSIAKTVDQTFHKRNESFVSSIISQLSNGQKVVAITGLAHISYAVDKEVYRSAVDYIYNALENSGYVFASMVPADEKSVIDYQDSLKLTCVGRDAVDRVQNHRSYEKITDLSFLRSYSADLLTKMINDELESSGERISLICLIIGDYFKIWENFIESHES